VKKKGESSSCRDMDAHGMPATVSKKEAKRLKKIFSRETSKEIKLFAHVDQRLRYSNTMRIKGKTLKAMKIEGQTMKMEEKAIHHHAIALRAAQTLARMNQQPHK